MPNLFVRASIFVSSILLYIPVVLAGEDRLQNGATAQMLAGTCAACHGADGVSQGNAPTIAGLSAEYIRHMMRRFQKDKAGSTIMARIAKGYTEAEVQQLADYFSKRQFVAASQSFDPVLAKKGKLIHAANCSGCHNKNGTVARNNRGFLAGQRSFYLREQMRNFLTGKRVSLTMQNQLRKAGGLKAIDALVAYYASVKPDARGR